MKLKKDCKVGFYTFGCRLNFAETEELKEVLAKKKFKINSKNPSLIIVRACSVTKRAENEAGAKARSLKRQNRKLKIILAGCLRDDFQCQQADLILPKSSEKELLKKIVKILPPGKKIEKKTTRAKFRTRAFIKIQDGCSNFCSYCLIPFLRCHKKSLFSKDIIKATQQKIKEGYQEVVLTGVNIGQWQESKRNLIWLIKKILKETKISRLRISSLWPDEISEQFIDLFKNHRLGRHLHLSLQSFSQTVLTRMKRYYDLAVLQGKIKKLRKEISDLTITADIIVGFPGETEKEFKETIKRIKKNKLSRLHVFRYSIRPGTAAAMMNNQVESKIKKSRSQKLLQLSGFLNKKWRSKFLGQQQNVLFEQKKNNFWQGLTNNYLKVFVKSKENLANQILPVKLIKLYQDGIFGRSITKRQ